MTCRETLLRLEGLAEAGCLEGMARFGIAPGHALGVRIPRLRALAREIGCDHGLALELFLTGIHEARILASMIASKERFTPADMDAWVEAFDSWDVCDQCCMNLFRRVPFAWERIPRYAAAERMHTRRAGYALLATLAAGDKRTSDGAFRALLPLIEAGAADPRDPVRKAVNWALRQIGKHSRGLWPDAIAVAERLAASPVRSARWIGTDALRELRSERILARIPAPRP